MYSIFLVLSRIWLVGGVGLLKYCGRTGTEVEIKTSQSSYFYEGANKMFRTGSKEWEGRRGVYWTERFCSGFGKTL